MLGDTWAMPGSDQPFSSAEGNNQRRGIAPSGPNRRTITRLSENRSYWKATTTDLIVELSLFLCSYAPLFAILAIRFEHIWLIVTCGLLAGVGFGMGAAVLLRFRSVTASTWVARTAEDRGGEVAGYLATYLLPFVTVAEPGVRDVIGYVLFLVIVGVIYVRSSLVQINPTLYLFGWRLYGIEVGDGWSGYLLARRPVKRGEELRTVRMTERLFVSYGRNALDAV
jgi:hypothetical protein